MSIHTSNLLNSEENQQDKKEFSIKFQVLERIPLNIVEVIKIY